MPHFESDGRVKHRGIFIIYDNEMHTMIPRGLTKSFGMWHFPGGSICGIEYSVFN